MNVLRVEKNKDGSVSIVCLGTDSASLLLACAVRDLAYQKLTDTGHAYIDNDINQLKKLRNDLMNF